ncbi:uncharacterized protein DFL_007929 [Arthrobotrys flagrans]|uniref:Uncharacterized protein n=1 Tax=Arthrobotrys flagrans TaxID=97331 RepID=A0A436ZXW1_ARTFL|nr:hypothetical protein DFL_007929 [Arthrobotrys flagrans]
MLILANGLKNKKKAPIKKPRETNSQKIYQHGSFKMQTGSLFLRFADNNNTVNNLQNPDLFKCKPHDIVTNSNNLVKGQALLTSETLAPKTPL